MKNAYAITNQTISQKEYVVCMKLDEDRNPVGVHICDVKKAILNHIYVGRVERIAPAIKAAFVRFGQSQICFLPLSEAKSPFYVQKNSKKEELCAGDEILIQITREALKEKEPAASCHLSLHGKYMVLTTKNKSFSISSRIQGARRTELENLLKQTVEEKPYGIVIRTLAASVSDDDIAQDYQMLHEQFESIMSKYAHRALYDTVWAEAPDYINFLKNQFEFGSDNIVTDSPEILNQLKEHAPVLAKESQLYTDQCVSLSVLYHIRGHLDDLLSNKIWLKSGSNIIIEQLETLTFIDVNTAKSNIKKSSPYSVNLEAMKAALRQIALRNISGMILIDFINMTEAENADLIELLKQETKKYPNPCRFIDITKLGLVELTRKKISRSVKDIVNNS